MRNLEKTGQPIYEAVSVDELKAHMRVFGSTDDTYIDTLRVAAREQVEKDLNLIVAGQSFAFHLETGFPSCLKLPVQPVQSVTEITYNDNAGNPATMSEGSYTLKSYADPPEIVFTNPPSGTDATITFVAGFPSHAEGEETIGDVPSLIKHAIYFLAASWFENRESVVVGTISNTLPLGYERIVSKLQVKRFH